MSKCLLVLCQLVDTIKPGHETILVVEDEEAILNLATKMLTSLGYNVLSAIKPSQAIKLANDHAGHIDLLLTDVIMPEMNGRDLASRLLSIYPEIKLIFMSGYTANIIKYEGKLENYMHFIQKPFSIRQISEKLREVLEN
jgi:CheY-like chemotaxis protein